MDDIAVNVLWIDDEHEGLSGLKSRFKRNGITLHPFKSKNAGLDELRMNAILYDAILLDGRILENEDDDPDTADPEYSLDLKPLFAELPKKLDVFVLTGQTEVFKDQTYKKVYKKLHIKGDDKSIENLIQELKESAVRQPQAQIRHRYRDVFEVLDDKYLGSDHTKRLMNLASDLESNDLLITTEDRLISLRKMIEVIFGKLVKLGVIPIGVKNDNGWITNSSKFLAGKHKGYNHRSQFIPPLIAELFHRVLNITQDGAHGDGNLRFEVDSYVKSSGSDYLYRSTILGLFEILVWLKNFTDMHPDKEVNLELWEENEVNTPAPADDGDWMTGLVTRVADNGYGTLVLDGGSESLSIIPTKVSELQIQENDRLRVTTKPSPDGSQTYINEIEKVR